MRRELEPIFNQANRIILDKEQEVKLALSCLLAGGHLLIEDVPGVGKTTMVQVIARTLNLDFGRVQFTNDLLPADILGTAILDPNTREFHLHKGPIFVQLLLADELNRATPKTQSALLQAMEEQQVTIDGTTHDLPSPFFVVATQNPRQQVGTFPLPESELDRFLMRIEFGFPNRAAEAQLLKGEDRWGMLNRVEPVTTAGKLQEMQAEVRKVHTADAIIEYVQNLLDASRTWGSGVLGLSPRAGMAMVRAARAWAWMEDRDMVIPEDVQAVAESVMAHRLSPMTNNASDAGWEIAREILRSVAVE